MRTAKLASAALVLASIIGCQPPNQQTQQKPPADDQRLLRLQHEVEALDARVDLLESSVREDEIRIPWPNKSAIFDPTESLFQRVDTEDGAFSFLVSIHDIHPFGDGVKVTIHLGNTSTATFNGVKLTIKYGKRRPPEVGKWAKWQEERRTKVVDELHNVLPGHWNPITVALPAIASQDFGYLELSIDAKLLSMQN